MPVPYSVVVISHRAACVSVIMQVVIYHSGDPHRRPPERGPVPDLCHGLKERIGYKSGLKRRWI